MAPRMQAVFYRDKEGREPVNDFIDRLPVDQQVEVDATIALLNRLGPSDPPLPFPFSSQIRGSSGSLGVTTAGRCSGLSTGDPETFSYCCTFSRRLPQGYPRRKSLQLRTVGQTLRGAWKRHFGAGPGQPEKMLRNNTVINLDNIGFVKRATGPIGTKASDAAARRATTNLAYRRRQEALAPYREIAWLLIKYRMKKGLTQKELAELIGTSHTQISRIESGRHKPSFATLSRMADALDLKMVLGFEPRGGSTKKGRKPAPNYIVM